MTHGPGFNPLPSPKRGETPVDSSEACQWCAFQSAPLTEARGDVEALPSLVGQDLFQSAPLTEARGDSANPAEHATLTGFNPLPSPKRGETLYPTNKDMKVVVSIRSPHRSEGRPPSSSSGYRLRPGFNPLPSPKRGETVREAEIPAFRERFQSAPLTEARGDHPKAPLHRSSDGFNPLPSPKRGETGVIGQPVSLLRGFNPLPSPKRGETLVAVTSGILKGYTDGCAILSNG